MQAAVNQFPDGWITSGAANIPSGQPFPAELSPEDSQLGELIEESRVASCEQGKLAARNLYQQGEQNASSRCYLVHGEFTPFGAAITT